MRAATIAAAAIAAATSVVSGGEAAAKPMFEELATIVKDAPTIVIARYHRPAAPFAAREYELLVERPLRGTGVRPGTVLRVAPSPSGHAGFADGTRVVAFVDAQSRWIAAATVAVGASLESGVLHVEGFNDENAFLVSPGTLTLAQLVPFVATGKPMAWKFAGPVLVGSPAGLVASKIVVGVELPGGRVTGIDPKGFPKPEVIVGSGMGEDVYATWQRELGRPLALEGVATGVAADGSIAVEWRTEYPELVTEADLRAYLADPKKGHPSYELVLRQTGKPDAKVILGDEIGRIGTIGGVAITFESMAPKREIGLGAATIALGPPRAGFVARSHEALVEEAMTGPIACTYRGGACTLAYVATHFTKR